MGYSYLVLGAGRQGTAAAYDLAKHAEADSLLIADHDMALSQQAAAKVNGLLRSDCVQAAVVDVRDHASLVGLLGGVDAVISAVPYRFNLAVARAAIQARASMCDLGGNTELVWRELALDEQYSSVVSQYTLALPSITC